MGHILYRALRIQVYAQLNAGNTTLGFNNGNTAVIVGAWVVLQVADLAFESWGISSSALRYVWLAAILGFPVALVFACGGVIGAQLDVDNALSATGLQRCTGHPRHALATEP